MPVAPSPVAPLGPYARSVIVAPGAPAAPDHKAGVSGAGTTQSAADPGRHRAGLLGTLPGALPVSRRAGLGAAR